MVWSKLGKPNASQNGNEWLKLNLAAAGSSRRKSRSGRELAVRFQKGTRNAHRTDMDASGCEPSGKGGGVKVIRFLRKQAGEDSPQAAELFSAVLEAAEDAVLVAEEGGGLIYANRAAARLLGYSRAELEGKPLRDIGADLDGKRWMELWKQWKRPDPHVLETFCRRQDGSAVLAEATCSHLVVGARGYHCVFLREAGRRQHLEEQLRQSQKMEAVGRLAAGVAHDFNNLLTAVMLYSGLLLNQLGPNSRLRRHADEIRMVSERGAALVGQLLMFSRQAAAEPRPLNLNEVIGGAAGTAQADAGRERGAGHPTRSASEVGRSRSGADGAGAAQLGAECARCHGRGRAPGDLHRQPACGSPGRSGRSVRRGPCEPHGHGYRLRHGCGNPGPAV